MQSIPLQSIPLYMNKDIIKTIITDRQRDIPGITLQRRNTPFGPETNYVLVGLRRAGKSYMLYQDIQQRIEEGRSKPQDILFVNFEDERLTGMRGTELNIIMEAYYELYGTCTKPVVYLDEIQNVEGWHTFARRLADEGYRLMITGSNAKMLSREVASTLGGRFIPREINPFSFREYVEYSGITIPQNWQYDSNTRAQLAQAFEHYITYGGIAETFRQPDKREYLNALYQKILVGDIVERNNIRNPRIFRLLARRIADSVMQPTSLSRLQHIIKSTGDSISLPVLKDYLEYMNEAYLTFDIPNMASAPTERETLKKRYFTDNGILNLFLYQGETKLLENIVATHLNNSLRTQDNTYRLLYYNKNIEVDFCVPEQQTAIQVTHALDDPATADRETSALEKFIKAFPNYHPLIITRHTDTTIQRNNITINVTPAWKWLMESEE